MKCFALLKKAFKRKPHGKEFPLKTALPLWNSTSKKLQKRTIKQFFAAVILRGFDKTGHFKTLWSKLLAFISPEISDFLQCFKKGRTFMLSLFYKFKRDNFEDLFKKH